RNGAEPLTPIRSRAVLPARIVDKGMNRVAKLAEVARRRLRSKVRCSFCGRDADAVGRLVAGPSVYICDACILACVEVLEQHGGLPPSPGADPNRLTHA